MNNVTEMPDREEIDNDLLVVDYVAGRLGSADCAEFEHRLEDDAKLRQAVDEERALRAALVSSSDAAVPPASGFERVRGDVEAGSAPSIWRSPSIAAGVAAIALVLVFTQRPDDIWSPVGEAGAPPAEFVGLSETPAQQSPASNRVIVVFAEGLTALERDVLAAELDFELLGGPNEAGAWTAVTGPGVNRDDLARWRQDPRIDLAEPQRYE